MSRKNRQRRANRAASDIPDDDIVIVEPEGEEVVPPEPKEPEVAEAGDELDPLDVLRREVDEHKAARAEADRKLTEERAERERLQTASADHATSKLAQDRLVIEQAFTAAEGRSKEAKRAFRDAMEAGNFDAAAEAQAAIARVENEMQRYADAYQVIEERSKAPPPPQAAPAPANDLDTAIAGIRDPRVRQWASEHKSDLADPKRLQLAYAADNLAIARGLEPGSDDYLDFLDEQLGYEMEEQAPPPPKPAAPPRRRAPPVAAPVSRSAGGKVSVTLSDTDKAFAQQLGITHKDYARSIVGAKDDPRYNKYNNRAR